MLATAALTLPLIGCGRETEDQALSAPRSVHLSGVTMGTTWNVTVARIPSAIGSGSLQGEIQAVLDRVDMRMSTWKPDSELSRFNAAPAGATAVSAETAQVVREALRSWERSDGAFDPTVMPLVDLWGFGPAGRDLPEPSAAALDAALESCGAQRLHVRDGALVKDVDGLQVDLSAIAKGYAVDAVYTRLLELHVEHALVEVGGELRALGLAEGERPWRIGIDRPSAALGAVGGAPGEALQAVLELDGRAVATSGDYRNFRDLGGVAISHTIDPRTGHPVHNTVASATVLAPTCMEADALATALMVLGVDQGLELIESLPGVDATLILRAEPVFLVRSSSAFPLLAK